MEARTPRAATRASHPTATRTSLKSQAPGCLPEDDERDRENGAPYNGAVKTVKRDRLGERQPGKVTRKRLVRGKDGKLVFIGGPPVNGATVRKLLENFP